MYDEKTLAVRRLLYLLDMCLTVLVFIGAIRIRESASVFLGLEDGDFSSHIAVLPLILAFLTILLPRLGAYRGLGFEPFWKHGWAVTRAMCLAVGILLIFLFLIHVQYISRAILLLFMLMNIAALTGARGLIIWWYGENPLKSEDNNLKVLVVGTGKRAERLSETLRKNVFGGIDIIGYIDPDCSKAGESISGVKVIGSPGEINRILKSHVIDEVIIAIPRTLIAEVEELVYTCEEQGVKLRLMADVFDLKEHKVSLVTLGKIPLLTLESVAHDEIKLMVKRLFDITMTLLAMPFLLPLMAVVGIAVKLDSPGSVFFVQKRVGFKKRRFNMYKFRSMYKDSEERLTEIEHLNEAEGPIFKIKDDPRLTRVGRFIRRTSLDEIPQFFNVLSGDMSLVGPRPMSVRDVELFDKGIQRKRFSVKPGLTCIWQVSGRSNLTFSKWLELDLEYIDKWSLFLDLKILARTLPAVLHGGGAV